MAGCSCYESNMVMTGILPDSELFMTQWAQTCGPCPPDWSLLLTGGVIFLFLPGAQR